MFLINNVTKIYKSKKCENTKALNNVSLKFGNKGLIFILGRSGSGKTTFLNIIGGLDKYDSGEIIFNDKSFNKFKSKDYDFFRNTNVGFVFQDFNLFEEYNVYQNIELAVNLQKSKIKKDRIDILLKNIGLESFGKRKINELSGGQKQRVAIARAIVKKPSIILADEPTGSLDFETGNQILELLKKISKEKLVIVVSHDIEAAKKYADRIIEMKDGTIINDIGNNSSENDDDVYSCKKSKLPFISTLKFALANLKVNKIRLAFSIILTGIALTFFGMSKILSEYNIPYSHAETMKKENNTLIAINKNVQKADGAYAARSGVYLPFLEDDINKVEFMLKKDTYKMYNLFEGGSSVNFDIPRKIDSNTPIYYNYLFSQINFVELSEFDDFEEFNVNIIGNFPEKYDEIVIHKYLADYIIYNGIYLYTKDNKKEIYYPKSYEEIIADAKEIKLGSTKVKIVGIVDDDLSTYDSLKSSTYNTDNANIQNLSEIFVTTYGEINKIIFVKEGFKDNVVLNKNDIMDNNYFQFSINIGDVGFPINSDCKLLDEKIKVYNGTKDIDLDSLNKDEIVINEEYLDMLTNYALSEELSKYINLKIQEQEDAIKEQNEMIDKVDEILEENPDADISEYVIKDVIIKTEEDYKNDYIYNYLNENNIIGSYVSIIIFDNEKRVNKKIENDIGNLKIVGYIDNGTTFYISNNILEPYIHGKYEIMKLYFNENNYDMLIKIFRNIPIDNSLYTTETSYSSNIISAIDILEKISLVSFYACIVFFIFASMLIINFIGITVTNNKKQIGILRAIGARKIDVLRIYTFEGLVVGLLSFIIALIICIICTKVGNMIFTQKLLFSIEPIMFNLSIIIKLLLVTLTISFFSTILSISKINKMKPVDAISNK